ncbi:MAG: hypothetical protein AAF368_14055, partial [Planctomycetota bacterium]
MLLILALLLSPVLSSAQTSEQEAKPLLRVHVIEESGAALSVQWKAEERSDLWGFEAWPKEPLLVVLPKRACAEDAYLERIPVQGVPFKGGDVGYLLEPEREYYVGVYGGDVPLDPAVVRLRKGESFKELTLTIRHEERVPVETALYSYSSKTVLIEDERTGLLLVDGVDFWRRLPDLPRGQYRVHVQDIPEYGMHGELYALAKKGRRTTRVDTSQGGEFRFDTDLPAGARLEVLLWGEAHLADREALGLDRAGASAAAELGPLTAHLDLVPDRGTSHR